MDIESRLRDLEREADALQEACPAGAEATRRAAAVLRDWNRSLEDIHAVLDESMLADRGVPGCVSETYTTSRPRPVALGYIQAVVKETRVRPARGVFRAPFQPLPFAVYS